MEKIRRFRGEYIFLSNMFESEFEWDGRVYGSSEAAFQSAKSLDPAVRERFTVMSGREAKREGKRVALRGDWETVKDDIMEEIVREKFRQNPELLRKLMDTGDAELEEGNTWHDTYWGVDMKTGKGENHLGIILMKIRAELGGKDYAGICEDMQRIREEEAEAKRKEAEEEIARLEGENAASPLMELAGREFATKAFGRVTIIDQEGRRLYFEARGTRKEFLLPGCIVRGFLIPDDETLMREAAQMDERDARIKEMIKFIK